MAHKILTDVCTGCGACERECPNKAISHKGKVFKIDPKKCKDCVGSFDTPAMRRDLPAGRRRPARSRRLSRRAGGGWGRRRRQAWTSTRN